VFLAGVGGEGEGLRRKGHKMKKTILILSSLTILLLFPNLVLADCMDLGRFTSWMLEDTNEIIFYEGQRPLALLSILNCEVRPSSIIRLTKSYICDSDSIIIDGEECSIMTVKALY
jgi:hypothetical protein